MNITILRIQLWELWRIGRSELAWRAGGLLVCFLVFEFLGSLTLSGAGLGELRAIFIAFAYVGLLLNACFPFLYGVDGTPGRGLMEYLRFQWAKPVPTLQLVLIPLLFGVFLQSLSCGGLACVLHFCFGLTYPFVTPLLFALVVSMVLSGCAYAFRGPWTAVGDAAVLGGILFWRIWPNFLGGAFILEEPEHWRALFDFSAPDYAVLGAVAGAAVTLAYWGARQHRHDVNMEARAAVSAERVAGELVRATPFSTALQAQLWMEWRRILGFWPLTAVVLVLAVGLSAVTSWWGLPEQFYILIWIMVLLICPVMLLVGGAAAVSGMDLRRGACRLSVFDATQPLPPGEYVRLKVAVLLASTFACLLVMGAVAACAWYLLPPATFDGLGKVARLWHKLVQAGGEVGLLLAFAAVMLVSARTLALITLAGHYALNNAERKGAALTSAAIGALVTYVLLALVDITSTWDFAPVWKVTGWAVGVVLLVKTVRGLWCAWRQRLLAWAPLVVDGLVWLVFLCAVCWLAGVARGAGFPVANIHVLVFLAGLVCVPLGSGAWAPLALAARRSQ